MAMAGNPVTSIATILGCSTDTLHRRFAAVIKKGYERGNHSLRLMQYQKAMDGNTTMLIWLGKQRLGQSDRSEVKQTITPVKPPTPEEVLAELKKAYEQRTGKQAPPMP